MMNNLNDDVNELWLPIPGFEEYLVSNLGRVFSKKTNRVLKPVKNGSGYLKVDLCKSGGVYPKKVHRLVLSAFCPTLDSTLEANHINGIKTDNRIYNLEWVTRSENIRHSAHQLGNAYGRKPKPVSQFTRDGQLIAVHKSMADASRSTGVGLGNIYSCAKGSRKQAGGFIWRYIEDTSLSNAA